MHPALEAQANICKKYLSMAINQQSIWAHGTHHPHSGCAVHSSQDLAVAQIDWLESAAAALKTGGVAEINRGVTAVRVATLGTGTFCISTNLRLSWLDPSVNFTASSCCCKLTS